jgi:hypothetical protein
MESAQNILTSFAQSPETVVLKYIFDIIEKLSCSYKSKNILGFIKKLGLTILTGSWKIIAILVIQHYVRNPDKLMDLLKKNIRPFMVDLFYRKYRIDGSGGDSLEANMLHNYLNNSNCEYVYRGFTSHFDCADGLRVGNIIYNPIIHYDLIRHLKEKAQRNMERRASNKKTICIHDDKEFEPLHLFPSKNYVRLNEMVRSYNEVSKLTKTRQPRAILIDGEPGLGKTSSIDALATLGTYGLVCRVDMTKYINSDKSIQKIFDYIYTKHMENIDGLIVVLFDEIDKYISRNIRVRYQNECKKLLKVKYSKVEKPKEPGSSSDVELPNLSEQDLIDWESFQVDYRENFLYDLLHLIEITYIKNGIVFIFCSNNFDSIFDGVNMKHFRSLRDRFVKVTFKRCDKPELIDYIKYYNKMLVGTEWHYPSESLDKILSGIREDLAIPYRVLTHTTMKAGYKMEILVDILNRWKAEDISDDDDEISKPQIDNLISGIIIEPSKDAIQLPLGKLGTGGNTVYYLPDENGLVVPDVPFGKRTAGIQYGGGASCINKNQSDGKIDCEVIIICNESVCKRIACACNYKEIGFEIHPSGMGWICKACMRDYGTDSSERCSDESSDEE